MLLKVERTMAHPLASLDGLEAPDPTGRSLKRHGVRIDPLSGNKARRVQKREERGQYACWCFVLAILVGGILMTIFLTRDMHRSPLAR